MKRYFQSASAFTLDLFSFFYMNLIHGRTVVTEAQIHAVHDYLDLCEKMDRETFFAPQVPTFAVTEDMQHILWQSPVPSGFEENDLARADIYWSETGPQSPTVILLHALMSASDAGYKRWARRFNAKGWNAVFVHLPYHYSRKPRGYWNGQLAISADLVRTAEGLRQGVLEIRQIMSAFRAIGVRDFGLWGSSYGGWLTATLASVEADFQFIALLEPITNIEHAIFESRACAAIARQLRKAGIGPEQLHRHFHLSSPLHAPVLTPGDRIFLAAGTFDDVALPADVRAYQQMLTGSEYIEMPQGHVGFALMEEAWRWLERRDLFVIAPGGSSVR
jgi:pimeloyl-ACP methyl ester carboxylesterase